VVSNPLAVAPPYADEADIGAAIDPAAVTDPDGRCPRYARASMRCVPSADRPVATAAATVSSNALDVTSPSRGKL
jgi:hypothetical protein